jgi:hypothetical protein
MDLNTTVVPDLNDVVARHNIMSWSLVCEFIIVM